MHGLAGFGEDVGILGRGKDSVEVGLMESLAGLE
jgi:hypothetical protein